MNHQQTLTIGDESFRVLVEGGYAKIHNKLALGNVRVTENAPGFYVVTDPNTVSQALHALRAA